MFSNINFKPGKITFSDIDFNVNEPLTEQLYSLKEDLFQVNYYDEYIIDVGWFPEFNPDGSFRITVVKDFDWENPVLIQRCKTIEELIYGLQECVRTVTGLITK